jgi:hypothetical protein
VNAQLAARYARIERDCDLCKSAIRHVRARVEQCHVIASYRRNVRDAAAHHSSADNRDTRHNRSRIIAIP